MSTYVQIIYHIVFSTKDRTPALEKPHRSELFKYMAGILRNKDCHVYQVNGVEDHVHILTSLHPSVMLSELVKDLKFATGNWIKRKGFFPLFTHWQDGYAAFTASIRQLDAMMKYVIGQEAHHRQIDSREELIQMLKQAQIRYDSRYLV